MLFVHQAATALSCCPLFGGLKASRHIVSEKKAQGAGGSSYGPMAWVSAMRTADCRWFASWPSSAFWRPGGGGKVVGIWKSGGLAQ